MSKSWKERIYPYLPIPLQNVACGFQGRGQRKLRYGGPFPEVLNWLEESQWWSAQKIQEHQQEQLEKLIRHAYESVPYYKDLFHRIKLKPADIKSPEDLYKIPVLTKEDVRNNYERMVSREFDRKSLVFCHTSGTTGKSLKFYQEPRAIQFRWAVWWRHKARFGVKFDEPYATFTGLTAIPINQMKPPFWRENRPMRQTVFTMHHIVPSKIGSIAARLNEGGFVYYAGYPSILYVLAALLLESGLKILAPPKYIFTGAENLYENQRDLISKAFRSPVTDQYGFSEGCGNASRCEHDLFHEDFEFGILECGDAETIDSHTKQGRIIATGFSSYGMPFIRYDVGDAGTWKDMSCACGRKSKVLTKINGRVEDFVITPEGRRILRFDYIFKDAENVRDAQVVQKAPGSICLRIVRRPAYSFKDEELLREEVKNRVSPMLVVLFEYVDEIERESNGKVRAVKSLLRNQIETSNSTL
jgi:phenylacetate-CoA ligase